MTPPCDEELDECRAGCAVPDADGDGVASLECGGSDCDDSNPNRFAGAIEVCDEEGIDEDCDPETLGDVDVDGDGQIAAFCCNGSRCGRDCEDRMPDVFVGATETCDLRDQDCDGNVDEGVATMAFVDEDGDRYGTSEGVIACAGAAKTAPTDIDCDDDAAPRHGAQVEVCDGIDNDCDDTVDEDTIDFAWYPDADGDGFGDPAAEPVIACAPPADHSLLPLDCDDEDAALSPAAAERCNGLDDDCDGVPSFEIRRGDTEDDDRDGYGDEACGGDDCDDRDPFNHPGGVELCDGLDNDCDGSVDEDVADQTWYLDVDGDGHGDPSLTLESCERQPDRALRGDDCDDGDPSAHPGRREVCDGVDNDCDGTVDEGRLSGLRLFEDADGDGFGTNGTTLAACLGDTPSGFSALPGDCDDTDGSIAPNAAELCDGLDNDCDGALDEGPPVDWFADLDGDGFGSGAVLANQCAPLAGAVPQGGDCDEGDPLRLPGASERCDGVDDDCDLAVDEGAPREVFYADGDGDGFADDSATPAMDCTVPVGSTTQRGDCDDADPARSPSATELCDAVDQDCDGTLDEGLPLVTVFPDADGDGFGEEGAAGSNGCGAVPGFATVAGDCDDSDPERNPDATDVCNGADDDCSGTVDDGIDNFCGGAPGTTGVCVLGGEPLECACTNASAADCDLSQGNGCETDLMISNDDCGACGTSCGLDQFCDAGSCSPAALLELEMGFNGGCARREGSRIICWGSSPSMVIGSPTPSHIPLEADNASGFDIVDFSRGQANDTYCLIHQAAPGVRDVYCWGVNDGGQVGNGTVGGTITTPTRIVAAVDDVVDDWVEVETNGRTTFARRATGEVYAWGTNSQGELGRGTTSRANRSLHP